MHKVQYLQLQQDDRNQELAGVGIISSIVWDCDQRGGSNKIEELYQTGQYAETCYKPVTGSL